MDNRRNCINSRGALRGIRLTKLLDQVRAFLTAEQVRIVTNWNQDRTAIYAIELSSREAGPSESTLAQLARGNRGNYRLVPLAAGE